MKDAEGRTLNKDGTPRASRGTRLRYKPAIYHQDLALQLTNRLLDLALNPKTNTLVWKFKGIEQRKFSLKLAGRVYSPSVFLHPKQPGFVMAYWGRDLGGYTLSLEQAEEYLAALEAGFTGRHDDLEEWYAQERLKKAPWLGVPCPKCGAGEGESCGRSADGGWKIKNTPPHSVRLKVVEQGRIHEYYQSLKGRHDE